MLSGYHPSGHVTHLWPLTVGLSPTSGWRLGRPCL